MHANRQNPWRHLPDDVLLQRLRSKLAEERRNLVEVLRMIAEVDRRRLYAQQACESMFAYATSALGLSESAAYKRIRVARAGRLYPSIFERIADGRHHLSGLCVLVPHLTADNHAELLDAASKLGKRRIEQLVAERFPKPDVATSVHKQPEPSRPKTAPIAVTTEVPTPTVQPPALSHACYRTDCRSDSAPSDSQQAATMPTVQPPDVPSGARPMPPVVHRQRHPQPLAPDRYLIKVTVSSKVKDALGRCQDLLAEQVPNGDIAKVLEHALDALLQKQLKNKYALGVSARRTSSASRTAKRHTAGPEGTQAHTKEGPETTRSRAIPAAIRRAVYGRDGGQCCYVDPKTGKRCQARRLLQFHHRRPFARGGEHTVDNICLACRTHNAHQARLDFGPAQIEAAISARQSEANNPDSPRGQLQRATHRSEQRTRLPI